MVNVSILRYALGWQVINFLEDARQIGTCLTHRMTESGRIKKSKKKFRCQTADNHHDAYVYEALTQRMTEKSL